MKAQNTDSENFANMQKSLEKIVSDIGDPQLGLDQLIQKVEAGYELIEKMKTKLGQTTKKIEDLHKEHQSEVEA